MAAGWKEGWMDGWMVGSSSDHRCGALCSSLISRRAPAAPFQHHPSVFCCYSCFKKKNIFFLNNPPPSPQPRFHSRPVIPVTGRRLIPFDLTSPASDHGRISVFLSLRGCCPPTPRAPKLGWEVGGTRIRRRGGLDRRFERKSPLGKLRLAVAPPSWGGCASEWQHWVRTDGEGSGEEGWGLRVAGGGGFHRFKTKLVNRQLPANTFKIIADRCK